MDQFVGEIRMFAGNFPPKGWAFCNGQLLPLAQNTALFSLLGTSYGGDGKSTFALPNLQGCVPLHAGQGPGLSAYYNGDSGGSEMVTLLVSEMPSHSHTLEYGISAEAQENPAGQIWKDTTAGRRGPSGYASPANTAPMGAAAIKPAGGGVPHNNMQPYLTVNFIIALQGIFPPRG